MDLDAAWAVGVGVMFATMGVPAVVTRPAPDDTPISTRVIWETPLTGDEPTGSTFSRREPARMVSLLRSEVPTVPKKTRIVAAELTGGTERTWSVERDVDVLADVVRVLIVPLQEAS